MMSSYRVPKGYKLTEVGVIPEDWNVKRLGTVAEITMGQSPSSSSYNRLGVGIPLIQGNADIENRQTIKRVFTTQITKRGKSGDILMSVRAPVGEIARATFDVCLGRGVCSIRYENDFLYHYLIYIEPTWTKHSKGSTFDSVNSTDIKTLEICLPSNLPEQRSIATVLSDMDELLGGLDRLLAKKRDLKQATMQQLLTGKKRLPGFSGEWEVKRLGDLGHFLKGSGVKKDQSQSGDIPCIRYGEIYTHHHNYIKSFNSWISSEVAKTATPLKKGDILFAGSGETKEEIGKCVAFVDDIEAYAGGDTVILRSFNTNAMFLGYYCNTGTINSQKASKGQGDAVVHISANALSSIEIKIPPLPEQTAIATILSDMDAEIASLEQRRDKTRALKQAVMQELLTGKTRLVPSGGLHA